MRTNEVIFDRTGRTPSRGRIRTAIVTTLMVGTLTGLYAAGISAQAVVGACSSSLRALPGVAGSHGDFVDALRLAAASGGRRPLLNRPSDAARDTTSCSATPWSPADTIEAQAAWLQIAPASIDIVLNSAYPRGGGYGALWTGRGVSAQVSAGVRSTWGPLTLSVQPVAVYQQNADFDFVSLDRPGFSDYGYPWSTGIDWPIRPGPDPISGIDAGQSYARLDVRGLSLGISSESLWWGPGRRNALLLGNDAPGFPHVFLSNGRGWSTRAGSFNIEAVWGRLSESDWFDADPENDRRFLALLGISWESPGQTGLSLGFARLYQQSYRPGSLQLRDLIPFFESPLKADLVSPDRPSGDDQADQIAGVMIRYAPPRTGFEIYAEWGRGDHAWNMADFFAEPEHNHAYTVGFQQLLTTTNRIYRVSGELTNLNPPVTEGRPPGPWYQHSELMQGHTHRGQLLGASIGTAADAQHVGFDIFTRRGRFGLYAERIRFDEYAYATLVAPAYGFSAHDVELTLGSDNFMRFGNFDLRFGLSYSNRRNRNFIHCNHQPAEWRNCQLAPYRDHNLHLPLGVFWRPRAAASVR
jgi:hypothetical protein